MKARLPQEYRGGGGGNMQNMMRQAQKMQEELRLKQEELESKEYSFSAGGGAVTAVVSGKKELVSISLKPEVVCSDDIEMLEDLVLSAVNGALGAASHDNDEEMGKIAGPMQGIPGLF